MRKIIIVAIMFAVIGVGVAPGWWVKGHETITEAATANLPDDMPAFFRAGGKSLAHFAGDPDRWKNREAQFLKLAEAPHHFLDVEDLDGNPPPKDRWQAITLMKKLGREPDKVGLLPWSIMEGFDRLTLAFYDYRKDPNNPAIPMKCLVYAGNLAHYTTDASMPLHNTRDYDGRPAPGGGFTQKGIHAKIDAFPEKNRFKPEEVCRGLQVQPIEDVWEYLQKFINESRTHIDECYKLDSAGAISTPTDESRAFIMARCRAGAQFTMDVWYAAWRRSEKMPPHY